MTKRSQGNKLFGRRKFKQRYFRLTTQSLSYAKSKGKGSICDIPLSEILAVKKLDDTSLKMQNIFQVSLVFRQPLSFCGTYCLRLFDVDKLFSLFFVADR